MNLIPDKEPEEGEKEVVEELTEWEVGEIRVIFDYHKDEDAVFVKLVDFRGRVYNKTFIRVHLTVSLQL